MFKRSCFSWRLWGPENVDGETFVLLWWVINSCSRGEDEPLPWHQRQKIPENYPSVCCTWLDSNTPAQLQWERNTDTFPAVCHVSLTPVPAHCHGALISSKALGDSSPEYLNIKTSPTSDCFLLCLLKIKSQVFAVIFVSFCGSGSQIQSFAHRTQMP